MISSLVFMLWIGIGTQVSKAYGHLKLTSKPYTIDGCRLVNDTTSSVNEFFTTTIATVSASRDVLVSILL